MVDARFQLVAVAFVRSVGGRIRVLFAVDRDELPLFDGEPALLVEHRPGQPAAELVVEGPDGLAAATLVLVRQEAGRALVDLVERAFDDSGRFDGQRLLGHGVRLAADPACFDT